MKIGHTRIKWWLIQWVQTEDFAIWILYASESRKLLVGLIVCFPTYLFNEGVLQQVEMSTKWWNVPDCDIMMLAPTLQCNCKKWQSLCHIIAMFSNYMREKLWTFGIRVVVQIHCKYCWEKGKHFTIQHMGKLDNLFPPYLFIFLAFSSYKQMVMMFTTSWRISLRAYLRNLGAQFDSSFGNPHFD